MSLKCTAFHDIHVRVGGKMVEFAGFEMPVHYSSILEEHRLVRERVGVFDVSHMGEIEIRGKDALASMQMLTVNDVSRLKEGRVQYSAMCYGDGGMIDDLLVYAMGDHYLLVVNAANTAKDLAWVVQHAGGDVTVNDKSDETSLLAVQGPKSMAVLQKLTDEDLSSLKYYSFRRLRLHGRDVLLSRTGYTGELGYEIYFAADRPTAEALWAAVMEAGGEFGIGPVGLGARDTLRLEMGYCLYGQDIDKTTNPLEAGLGWITKLDKGEFIGREILARVALEGVRRRLVGFVLEGKAFPRHGYKILSEGGETGYVTSGTFSPTLQMGIGMGYVAAGSATEGTALRVVIREREVPATVVPLPFVKTMD
jgi:aminomethyltransferase